MKISAGFSIMERQFLIIPTVGFKWGYELLNGQYFGALCLAWLKFHFAVYYFYT